MDIRRCANRFRFFGGAFLALYFLLSVHCQTVVKAGEGSTAAQLISDITGSSYNKTVIPEAICNRHAKPCPFIVQIRLFPIRVQDIIENQETMISTIRIQLGWLDPALKWDPANYGGITSVTIKGGNLWIPDLQIANSVDDMYSLLANDKFGFRVSNDGQVWFHPTGKVSTRCAIDLTYYPFDYQRCSIVVESVIYTSTELELVARTDKPTSVSLGMYTENKNWRVIDSHGFPVLYKSGPRTAFSRMHFWFILKRDPSYYQLTFLFPIALLSVLQLMTFFIPMHFIDRVAQATVVLMTAFFLEGYVADRLPKTSQQSLVQIYLNIIICVSVVTVGVCIITVEMMEPDAHLEWWGILRIRNNIRRRRAKVSASSSSPENNTNSFVNLGAAPKPSIGHTPVIMSKMAKAAAFINFSGFIICAFTVILYPTIALLGYIDDYPPPMPQPPPDNISLSYYAEA